MKKLRTYDREPRCGWCYDVPETGFTVRQGCWRKVEPKVREHYAANDLPVPDNLAALIEDQICGKIPEKFWVSDDGEQGAPFFSPSEMMERQKTLIKEMNHNRTDEFIASEDVAQQRMYGCISCKLNVNPFGCFPCSAHYKRIAGWRFQLFNKSPKAAGSDTTAYMCHASGVIVLLLIYATQKSILSVSRKIPFDRLPNKCWLRSLQPEENR